MAFVHDVHTQAATFTTVNPFTFTHTPNAATTGVIFGVYHGAVSTDLITGAVTYGGVALTRIATAADTVTEAGRVYLYWAPDVRGRASDTVSVTHSASLDIKVAGISSFYSDRFGPDGKRLGFGLGEIKTVAEDTANPTYTLSGTPKGYVPEYGWTTLCYEAVYSGTAGPTNTTFPVNAAGQSLGVNDFGNFCGGMYRQNTPSGGATPFTFTHTAASDDVAMAAVSIVELPPAVDDFHFPTPEWDPASEFVPATPAARQFMLVNTALGAR